MDTQASATAEAAANRVSWDIAPWCKSVGISRATIYALEAEQQPKSVKLGKRRLIVESPADYLARIAEASKPHPAPAA